MKMRSMVFAAALAAQGGGTAGAEVFADWPGGWVVEQQAGGEVTSREGRLVIEDKKGCTVWRREPLKAPVRIRYLVTMAGRPEDGRVVSDLNCFWMATDPRVGEGGDFFAAASGRDGSFASYDGLRTYYVGCGGNSNTTTRFRRYDGAGARPLLPEHDRREAAALLEEGREYAIEIVVTEDGRTSWARDGVVLFTYDDPEPLKEGWFGFRTVWSRMEVRDFRVEGM